MIRGLIRKVYHYLKSNPETPVSNYIKKGNISIGRNCDIGQLSVTIYGAKDHFVNIHIDDDCFLMGNIVLHRPEAIVRIGKRVFIGPNTTIFCYNTVNISNDVMFSWGCTIIDTNAHSLKSDERLNDVTDWKKGWEYKNWSVVESSEVIVEKKCWIGFNSIIMKGVTLGEGTVVAAGSVVTKNTEPFSVVGGNPATYIKKTI